MVEEEILEVEQEVRGLSALEQESRALEEADAKAVEEAREKRKLRKKKALRKKLFTYLFIFLAILSGIGAYLYREQQKEAAANATVEITAEEGQQILYAKITQIQGNEITFEETEPNIAEVPAEASSETPSESRTMQIPVGTEVTTMLGAVTTFSRLSADDTIALIMEGSDIIRIYIVQ